MTNVSPIPEGMNSLTPYLVLKDSVAAMEFYEKAFGAEQLMRMSGPGGQGTVHAEMKVGTSVFMLTDENPEWNLKSAMSMGGSPISLMLYVEDVDAAFAQAVAAGCEAVFPVSDMFWGDRMGKVEDPFGFQWALATHIEDVPPKEMDERRAKWIEEMAQGGGDCEATDS